MNVGSKLAMVFLIPGALVACVGPDVADNKIQVWVSGVNGILSRGEFRGKYEAAQITNLGDLRAISAAGENLVFFATEQPSVVRLDGEPLAQNFTARATSSSLNAIVVKALDRVWAVGNDGYIVRWSDFDSGNSDTWTLQGEQDLRGVSAVADPRVFVVGNKGTLARFDRDTSTWHLVPTPALVAGKWDLHAIFDTYGELWIVGDESVVLRADVKGAVVTTALVHSAWQSATVPSKTLRGVYAHGTHVWAVGDDGLILHSSDRGQSWAIRSAGTTEDLRGIAGLGDRLVAVGNGGIKLASKDGGKTWVDEDLETGPLATDDRTGVSLTLR